MKIVAFCLSLILFSNNASAYNMGGAGNLSCAKWVEDNDVSNKGIIRAAELSWILGFLSGIGYTGVNGADPLHNTDKESVESWVDAYCHTNPNSTVGNASGAFYVAHPH